MSDALRRILMLCTYDCAGGAARVCWNQFQGFRGLGHQAWLAVGRKLSSDPQVTQLSAEGPAIESPTLPQDGLLPPWTRLWRRLEIRLGREDFHFPRTRSLLSLPPFTPEVVHCHNLHGGYFDLRELPRLSRQAAVVLSLHDAWLLSGNCAHSFDCTRWEHGCGNCPDIRIYPGLRRDGSAANWRRKQRIYRASRLHVATACRWLMDKVQRSILAPALASSRIIPYGLDLDIFRPGDKAAARRRLGLPPEATVFLFTADSIRGNPWKDFKTLREAVARTAEQSRGRDIVFLGLGEDSPPERLGAAEIRFIPYTKDPAAVAEHYRAADLYLHAARVDTFPNVILEALACGTPVAATAVSGIPEQVRGLGGLDSAGLNPYGEAEATGMLAPGQDPEAMARAILALMERPGLLPQLGKNAAADARRRFDLRREVRDYLDWYAEILAQRGTTPSTEAQAS